MADKRDDVSSDMSRRHSAASDLNMYRVMRRDLTCAWFHLIVISRVRETHARERVFPACALRQSARTRLSSSLASLLIFPGRLEA